MRKNLAPHWRDLLLAEKRQQQYRFTHPDPSTMSTLNAMVEGQDLEKYLDDVQNAWQSNYTQPLAFYLAPDSRAKQNGLITSIVQKLRAWKRRK